MRILFQHDQIHNRLDLGIDVVILKIDIRHQLSKFRISVHFSENTFPQLLIADIPEGHVESGIVEIFEIPADEIFEIF